VLHFIHMMFQLKDVCRRELDRSEVENVRNKAVTSEYKQVEFGC